MDSNLNPATNPITTATTTDVRHRKGSGKTRIPFQMRLTNGRAFYMTFSAAVILMILGFLMPLALGNSGSAGGDKKTLIPILVETKDTDPPILDMPGPESIPDWVKDLEVPPGFQLRWPDHEGRYHMPPGENRRIIVLRPDGGGGLSNNEGGDGGQGGDGGGDSRNIIVWPQDGGGDGGGSRIIVWPQTGGIVRGGSRRIIVWPQSSGGIVSGGSRRIIVWPQGGGLVSGDDFGQGGDGGGGGDRRIIVVGSGSGGSTWSSGRGGQGGDGGGRGGGDTGQVGTAAP